MRNHAARTLEVGSLTRLFRALADETRVRIVALLVHGELCVCHVQEALALTQPTASRHLSVLKAAGVVESRRVRNWTYHRLAYQADGHRRRQLRALVAAFADQAMLHRDVARLMKARGPEACE